MKRILMLSSMILVVLFLAACGISGQPATLSSGNIKIVTTIFPPYDFAREIAKDKADITLLLKPGAESHSFEPTPQDIKTIENADLFIYTGSENDVWVEDLLASLGDRAPQTMRLIDCVPTVTEEVVEGMEHEHEEDHHDGVFEDADVQDRTLADWQGDWQSVYPYLLDGTLDLVFAHMTPAIADYRTFEKMVACSRKYCMMEKPSRRTDKVQDAAFAAAGVEPEKKRFDQDILYAFSYLWLRGYSPKLQYRQEVWRNKRTPEGMAAWCIDRAKLRRRLDPADEEAIRGVVAAHTEAGMVEEVVTSTIVTMYWEV